MNQLASRGQWAKARQVVSPNQDARPEQEVSLLLLHAISLPPGQFSGHAIEALFTNRLVPDAHPFFATIAYLRVSAHLLIRRDGECVQFVDVDQRAWHAGVSSYHGRERCNDFSIGIELEGTDELAYTDAQYQQLVAVTRQLISRYPAIADNITGHSDIAPVRKTDPGPAFDWVKFRGLLTPSSE